MSVGMGGVFFSLRHTQQSRKGYVFALVLINCPPTWRNSSAECKQPLDADAIEIKHLYAAKCLYAAIRYNELLDSVPLYFYRCYLIVAECFRKFRKIPQSYRRLRFDSFLILEAYKALNVTRECCRLQVNFQVAVLAIKAKNCLSTTIFYLFCA